MFGWFRDRVKNSRPWFRIDMATERLEGTKQKDGQLAITITQGTKQTSILVSRETAAKLSEWMIRMYPVRSSNVIPFRKLKAIDNDNSTSS